MAELHEAESKLSYLDAVTKQERAPGRPDNYEALLFHPVADDPATGSCYKNWEFEHGTNQRFYVGGLRWFKRMSGIDGHGALCNFGQKAADTVKAETNWWHMPNSRDLWQHCAPQQ